MAKLNQETIDEIELMGETLELDASKIFFDDMKKRFPDSSPSDFIDYYAVILRAHKLDFYIWLVDEVDWHAVANEAAMLYEALEEE